jgi:hypothetical protein
MARGGRGDDLPVQGTRDTERGSGQVHVEADETRAASANEKRSTMLLHLSKPTVLGSAVQMLIDTRGKLPTEIAEDVLLNANDVESLCSLPAGSLQNKVLSFPTLRQVW